MVTAHGREVLSQSSAAEQALLDGFLVKPVTASMLFDAVSDARSGGTACSPARLPAAASLQRLAGLRLLLVEDNANNQQVARELLEYEGASVQIASHGLEAVEAIAATQAAGVPFDVVLMDLQMPVMDGFTATRRIRQDLGQQALPIVAMTANAMASDREACLAAGMNDHVGKPFDLDDLVRVLRRHAGTTAAPAGAAVGAAVGAAAGAAVGAAASNRSELPAAIDAAAAAAGVDIATAVARLGGKLDVYRRLLRGFVADLALLPAQLQAHLARGEAAAAAGRLHTLKGLAATLGADALAAAAATGETLLAAGSPTAPAEPARTAVTAACARITAALPRLAGLLDALQPAPATLAAAVPAAAAAAHPAGLLAALAGIAALLRDGDMAATDAMARLQHQWGSGRGPQFEAMDEAIDAIDFARALRLCDALIHQINESLPA
jgi:CheY-like chemotaxis protein